MDCAAAAPIADPAELAGHLEAGCKPIEAWRIGTEHERFAFRRDTLRPLPYDAPDGVSIKAMLEGLAGDDLDLAPYSEGDNVIALKGPNHASITLEPGGQLELSGAPLETIHETCREVTTHHEAVDRVGERLGVGMLGMGFQPKWTRADIPWMPKGRYRIMRDYMPTRGDLGLDMMVRTCTVQVNLDFSSEADMVKKMRVSLALQPVATALFASSPFTEGRPNGFLSYRAHIWTRTDPDRTGDLPFVFEDGFGFERYTDYLLDVPMYFVYRNGRYIDAAGQSFRDFLGGKLPAMPGELPTMADWADHMTTAFPEVRLKRYIEMRGTDSGPWGRLCALPALWVGLLYDGTALDAAWDLVKHWNHEDRAALKAAVPRQGLTAPVPGGGTLQALAQAVLDISAAGLQARNRVGPSGYDERAFLAPLREIVDRGTTPADELLDCFHGPWGGSVDPVFSRSAFCD